MTLEQQAKKILKEDFNRIAQELISRHIYCYTDLLTFTENYDMMLEWFQHTKTVFKCIKED